MILNYLVQGQRIEIGPTPYLWLNLLEPQSRSTILGGCKEIVKPKSKSKTVSQHLGENINREAG